MNNNSAESGKQRFEKLKKTALMVFSTALRAPLLVMLGCGYVTKAKTFMDEPAEVHDDNGKLVVHIKFAEIQYNKAKHGKIIDWLEEGEVVPGLSLSTGGKQPIHRHNTNEKSGAHEYQYE